MFFTTGDESQSSSSSQSSQMCRRFEFDEILLATDNFDIEIGSGGFGKVYKGTILIGSSPVVAAFKRLDSKSKQGEKEFWAEVEMLSKLRHRNLFSLIGYCNDEREMILVYEYISNGSLEDHLHKFTTPLSWPRRLKICIDSAYGLEYLHTGIDHTVSSNILLHETWEAKISDFGLSKDLQTSHVSTKVNGTFGYLDPNYFSTGRLTMKSDVYAFGVLLFEVLCRKRAVDGGPDHEEWGLAKLAQESIKKGSLSRIIDSELRDQISQKCLKNFARIAHRCLHEDPSKRPTMTEVVSSLKAVLVLQEKPNNNLVQDSGITMFSRIFLPFSKGEHSGAAVDSKISSNIKDDGINIVGDGVESKLSSNIKDDAIITVGAENNMFGDTRDVPANLRFLNPNLQVFKFADLERVTKNFSPGMFLGNGVFGDVFIGWVDKNTFAPSGPQVGMCVAVKRFHHENSHGDGEWLKNWRLLGRLDHPNIISLLGYCNDGQENLLVYEYMQKGNLARFLYPNASGNTEPLSWRIRLNIMMGVARGLTYLHSSEVQVIHRGLNSYSILLDEDFNAKLGNFGLAKSVPIIDMTHVSTLVRGTFGYLDPEYFRTGRLTATSDIYSFGVVLLQTLTGQQPTDMERPEGQESLLHWVRSLETKGRLKKRELKKIMDPSLEQNYPIKGALECAALALRCVAEERQRRPTSEQVLSSLELIYAINN